MPPKSTSTLSHLVPPCPAPQAWRPWPPRPRSLRRPRELARSSGFSRPPLALISSTTIHAHVGVGAAHDRKHSRLFRDHADPDGHLFHGDISLRFFSSRGARRVENC